MRYVRGQVFTTSVITRVRAGRTQRIAQKHRTAGSRDVNPLGTGEQMKVF